MRVASVMEPVTVVSLLIFGSVFNRWRLRSVDDYDDRDDRRRDSETGLLDPANSSGQSSPRLPPPEDAYISKTWISRTLRRFPFLVEVWYWALIYWVYQLGRAVTAVSFEESTVDLARKHALQLVAFEKKLHIFVEPHIHAFFIAHPFLLNTISFIYSYIHIPGTILYLILLYYFCITRLMRRSGPGSYDDEALAKRSFGIQLYQARRRTMALCNLCAFIIFTIWPCMPPRLLPEVKPSEGDAGYRFTDPTHNAGKAGSVWTSNKFCNQYAAMPSLHFGYSLLIGMTIATYPTALFVSKTGKLSYDTPSDAGVHPKRLFGMDWKRVCLIAIGVAYPMLILTAIISTANHFILDAVAGACVCAIGWRFNRVLLLLVPVERRFLALIRVEKPLQ